MDAEPVAEDPRRTVKLHRLGRFLSLILRHRPARFPLALDEQGYADLRAVMDILRKLPNFRWVTRDDIRAVLALPGRRRFELQGHRIRALYGHSAVRPTYEPAVPPDVLYCGASAEQEETILREGLLPQEQFYLHLATTPELARAMALRRTADPLVLQVDARAAHRDGQPFYHPVDEIYLCEALPPLYVRGSVSLAPQMPDIPDEE